MAAGRTDVADELDLDARVLHLLPTGDLDVHLARRTESQSQQLRPCARRCTRQCGSAAWERRQSHRATHVVRRTEQVLLDVLLIHLGGDCLPRVGICKRHLELCRRASKKGAERHQAQRDSHAKELGPSARQLWSGRRGETLTGGLGERAATGAVARGRARAQPYGVRPEAPGQRWRGPHQPNEGYKSWW